MKVKAGWHVTSSGGIGLNIVAELQIASEAFLNVDGMQRYSGSALIEALEEGKHHPSYSAETQAVDFEKQWVVVDQNSNSLTGFSGTLFRNKLTNELVVSFRSTEFIDDNARDNVATNALEIKEFGFAFGQISDMQAWFKTLQDSGKVAAGEQYADLLDLPSSRI